MVSGKGTASVVPLGLLKRGLLAPEVLTLPVETPHKFLAKGCTKDDIKKQGRTAEQAINMVSKITKKAPAMTPAVNPQSSPALSSATALKGVLASTKGKDLTFAQIRKAAAAALKQKV